MTGFYLLKLRPVRKWVCNCWTLAACVCGLSTKSTEAASLRITVIGNLVCGASAVHFQPAAGDSVRFESTHCNMVTSRSQGTMAKSKIQQTTLFQSRAESMTVALLNISLRLI
jgi:hypothetical protein